MNTINDSLGIKDTLSAQKLQGKVEITAYDMFGRPMYRVNANNHITNVGTSFMLEKAFGKFATRSTNYYHPTTFHSQVTGENNVSITNTIASTSSAPVSGEQIFGFMLGNGGDSANGTKEILKDSIALKSDENNFSFLPLIRNNGVISGETYHMQSEAIDGYYYYFVYAFSSVTIDPIIGEDGSVATIIETIPMTGIKNYFSRVTGDITKGISQLGLVAGYKNGTSYTNMRLVTSVNFPTIDLSANDSPNMLNFRYKIYCM